MSLFARPRWNVASNLVNCALAAAAAERRSSVPKDIENTVPDGYFAIAASMAFMRFGRPCTPCVSAGGVASSTMCAFGAIAYAHSMSRVASPAQPFGGGRADVPDAVAGGALVVRRAEREDLLEVGRRSAVGLARTSARSLAPVGVPYASTSTMVWPAPSFEAQRAQPVGRTHLVGRVAVDRRRHPAVRAALQADTEVGLGRGDEGGCRRLRGERLDGGEGGQRRGTGATERSGERRGDSDGAAEDGQRPRGSAQGELLVVRW